MNDKSARAVVHRLTSLLDFFQACSMPVRSGGDGFALSSINDALPTELHDRVIAYFDMASLKAGSLVQRGWRDLCQIRRRPNPKPRKHVH